MSGADVLVFMALVAVLVATHACIYALGKLDGAMGAHEPPPAELYRRALRLLRLQGDTA